MVAARRPSPAGPVYGIEVFCFVFFSCRHGREGEEPLTSKKPWQKLLDGEIIGYLVRNGMWLTMRVRQSARASAK